MFTGNHIRWYAVEELEFQISFKLDPYQTKRWSQWHVFSVYLWKVMKSLDERNQAQHAQEAGRQSRNIVLSNLRWCLPVFLTQTEEMMSFKIISITMRLCGCVWLFASVFPSSSCQHFQSMSQSWWDNWQNEYRDVHYNWKDEKKKRNCEVNKCACRVAKCIHSLQTHEYSSSCVLLLEINKSAIVQPDINWWWIAWHV